jgi:hypothetical protein
VRSTSLGRSLVGSVTTLSLLVSQLGTAWACKKDRDCEGDLICDDGQCVPLGGAAGEAAAVATSGDAKEAPKAVDEGEQTGDSVRVDFQLPAPGEQWSLLTQDDQLVCKLPCSRWVPRSSGYKLQLDGAKGAEAVVMVPADLGFSPGRSVVAKPNPGEPPSAVPFVFAGLSLGVGIYGEIAFLTCNQDDPEAPVDEEKECGGKLAMFIGGFAGALVFALVGVATMTPPRLDMQASSSARQPFFRLGPGYAHASTGRSGVEMLLTPTSLSGVF